VGCLTIGPILVPDEEVAGFFLFDREPLHIWPRVRRDGGAAVQILPDDAQSPLPPISWRRVLEWSVPAPWRGADGSPHYSRFGPNESEVFHAHYETPSAAPPL
jgi:hypothetical protein